MGSSRLPTVPKPTSYAHPAAGGGRWVSVAPERLDRWLLGFAERHGPTARTDSGDCTVLTGADGARAEIEVPFPPSAGDLVVHALAERRVGVLLVRLGGHAVGVFEGTHLVSSKVGSRQVHGRSVAGGWSQQRFARRREGQVAVAHSAAADTAVRVLLPAVPKLAAVVVGGDRKAVDAVLQDRRLAALRPLVSGRLLDVPDPRQRVLESSPPLWRAVSIRLIDPPSSAEG